MSITDYRIRATAANGSIRAIATVVTATAQRAQEAHQATPVAAAAMGRLISSAVLLATDFKSEFRLTAEVMGHGPLGRVVAEIRANGQVRARVQHPHIELPLRADGKLAVGQAVGADGYFRVIREEGESAYHSEVALVSGEIGEDLMQYYVASEQIPSAVALGVLVGTDSVVKAAGGVVIQALPGSDEVIGEIEDKFAQLAQISLRLSEGESPEMLLAGILPGPITWYSREPVEFRCQCSKARSEAILAGLPRADLEDLVADLGAEVTCPYCRAAYQFSKEDLEILLSEKNVK